MTDSLDPFETVARIDDFEARYGPVAMRLAMHAAVADRLNPEMVAVIRANFLEGKERLQPVHDADLLFGPLCTPLGGGIYEMVPEVRAFLLRLLDRLVPPRTDWSRPRSAEVARALRMHLAATARGSGKLAFHEEQFRQQNLWRLVAIDEPQTILDLLESFAKEQARAPKDARSTAPRTAGAISLAGVTLEPFQRQMAYLSALDHLTAGDTKEGILLLEFLADVNYRPEDEAMPTPDWLLSDERAFVEARRDLEPDRGGSAAEQSFSPSGAFVNSQRIRPDRFSLGDTPLTLAIRSGDIDAVRSALADPAVALDSLDRFGLAALHHAVKLGREDLANLLLDAGANPSVESPFLVTPLWLTGEHGMTRLAGRLISLGSNPFQASAKGSTPLMLACHFGQSDLVDLFLRQPGMTPEHVSIENDDGNSALTWAAGTGDTAILDRLIAAGGRVEPRAPGRYSMLHAAAWSGSVAMVLRTIKMGFSVGAADARGWTPLHVACCERAEIGIVDLLLECGADPLRLTNEGWAPGDLAAYWDNPDVVARLDLARAPVTVSLLRMAADGGAVRTLTYLLDSRGLSARGARLADRIVDSGNPAAIELLMSRLDAFEADATSVFSRMIERGKVEAIAYLRTLGLKLPPAPRDKIDWLDWAMMKGNNQGTSRDLLLARLIGWAHAPLDAERRRKLMFDLSKEGLTASVAALISLGADPDDVQPGQQSPLAVATQEGKIEAATRLLDAGADPNRTNGPLVSPPVFCRNLEGLRLLLERGADPNRRALDGMGLLHYLVALPEDDNTEERWAFYLQLGLDPDARDATGQTPLHIAAREGRLKAAAALLASGARLEARYGSGLTPLLTALAHARTAMVEDLLTRGANPAARTAGGWTALHIAAERGLAGEVRRFWPLLGGRDTAAIDPARTAIQVAAEADAVESLRALLDLGVAPDHRAGGTSLPLVLALRASAIGTATVLLDACAKVARPDPQSGADLAALVGVLRRNQVWAAAPKETTDTFETALERWLKPPPPFDPAPVGALRNAMVARSASRIPGCSAFLAGLLDSSPAPGAEAWAPLGGSWPGRMLAALRELGPSFAGKPVRQFATRSLPFYQSVRMIRLDVTSWGEGLQALFFLDTGTERLFLDGRSGPIEKVNQTAPLNLVAETASDYLRFQAIFVRGEHGLAYIVEDAEDPFVASLKQALPEVLAKAARPLEPVADREAGAWDFRATIWQDRTLLRATLRVHPTGRVHRLGEAVLAADLPVTLHLPLT